MKRAVITTIIVQDVRDHNTNQVVGQRGAEATQVFEGDTTLDEICQYLAKHSTNTTKLTFESEDDPSVELPPKGVIGMPIPSNAN